MRDNDFDNHFESMKRTAIVGFVSACLVNIAIFSFIVWVVVKVMQHFGII